MKLRSSRVLRRVTPRVDPQYHIGVPDPHDLDWPRYPLSGLHTTPGDRFYNMNPIVQSNPGSSRESSMEPMDTDEAQKITDGLMQGIRNSGRLHRSGSLGSVPSPLSAAVHFPHPQAGASPTLGVPTPKLRCSHRWTSYGSSDTDKYSDPNTRGRCKANAKWQY